jgi:hypothetical protein
VRFTAAADRKKGLMDEEIAVIVREVTGSLANSAAD